MFNERLKKYRESKKLLKKEFAEKLEVSESYYNMIENGKRTPSKSFIEKLVCESNMPEEYWIYGIEKNEYINVREDLKCVRKAIEQILDLGLIKDIDKLFNGNYPEGTLEELLIAALKADVEYLLKKRNRK
ncbi:DNA-binding protein [Clostridium botulinum Af84]|uniref:helix-turn-helix domain-containing protein n=1 Tax=Clostridium botulinum TaxID=1491 RepID=UPI00035BA0CD|nr:helix-turn-helix transcriptional regulator [Clostridium botulinum]EPS56392.1 DNA-binding protein [Clostridium botulinum Af84]MBN3359531.1 transcriptional regulator [Clostridium botulinum]NFM84317.1 helix-turn-helix transcriptional regulator [Clostridium botulinum]NFP13124.1 helix-turn-helix transcriptional regulator [Clostridium botulinum]NFR30627.1 helix-turn-helix transcriptional regulator [Clostridium botulinum]